MVLGINGEALTLEWRDYPREKVFVRRLSFRFLPPPRPFLGAVLGCGPGGGARTVYLRLPRDQVARGRRPRQARASIQATRSPLPTSRRKKNRAYAVWFRRPLRRSCLGTGQALR